MRPFQRALVGLNNLEVHLSSREFNWASMSKIPSRHFQTEVWAIVFFNFFFDKFWDSIYLTYTKVWVRGFGLQFFFFFSSQRELHSVWNVDFLNFFVKLWLILSQSELSSTELPKCSPIILIENCDHTIRPVLSILLYDLASKGWFFEKYMFVLEACHNFKIACFLVR